MSNTSGNHIALGFGHDSLNSLNSRKVILGKTEITTASPGKVTLPN